ncbi:hypothetical protein AAVH_36264 [Aphelenchoides avenae]|nr:hypothetical protein AAVH_36264 [Aphelenchus avenae]
MKDYARSRASVETKTSIASAASELPTWYESETAAIVDISDWEHGSGHSAWSNVAEAELWQSILAKASDDYEVSFDFELPVVGAVDGDDWEGSHDLRHCSRQVQGYRAEVHCRWVFAIEVGVFYLRKGND